LQQRFRDLVCAFDFRHARLDAFIDEGFDRISQRGLFFSEFEIHG